MYYFCFNFILFKHIGRALNKVQLVKITPPQVPTA